VWLEVETPRAKVALAGADLPYYSPPNRQPRLGADRRRSRKYVKQQQNLASSTRAGRDDQHSDVHDVIVLGRSKDSLFEYWLEENY
jgi:hypothetical protein